MKTEKKNWQKTHFELWFFFSVARYDLHDVGRSRCRRTKIWHYHQWYVNLLCLFWLFCLVCLFLDLMCVRVTQSLDLFWCGNIVCRCNWWFTASDAGGLFANVSVGDEWKSWLSRIHQTTTRRKFYGKTVQWLHCTNYRWRSESTPQWGLPKD